MRGWKFADDGSFARCTVHESKWIWGEPTFGVVAPCQLDESETPRSLVVSVVGS